MLVQKPVRAIPLKKGGERGGGWKKIDAEGGGSVIRK